jgi:hypothetical protein
MKKILVSGNNKITEFIHNFLPLRGYEIVDITQLSAFQDNLKSLEGAECILDLNNTDTTSTDTTAEYDPEYVKELIDFAKSIKTSYIFAYQEPENSETESFLINILDFIDEYSKETRVSYVKVLIGDVYGTELTTSDKLKEILTSVVSEKPIYIDNEAKDYYLINQTDYIEGLEEIIKVFKTNKSPLKTYTLVPEEPLTEIELIHFIEDLNELELDINYSDEAKTEKATNTVTDLNLDVNYPTGWYPKTDLEKGLKALMSSYGIPVVGTESEELAEEEFMLNQDTDYDEYDNPLISMWDDTYDNETNTYSEVDTFENDDFKQMVKSSQTKPKKQAQKAIKKGSKVKASLLAVLLLSLLSSPSYFYNRNYAEAKSLLTESLYHLKTLNLDEAADKSSDSIALFEKIKNSNVYTTMVPFKKENTELLESSSKAVNYLAENFRYQNNQNVLGINNFSGVDKALEIVDLLESQKALLNEEDYKDIKDLLENKEIIKTLKEINPVMPEILGYNQQQKYLVLYLSTNHSKTLGDINYFSLVNIVNGNYTIEKTAKIDDLDSAISLNGGESATDITSTLNSHLFMENGLKDILNIYNIAEKEDVAGIVLVTTPSVKDLNKNTKFESTTEAEAYANQLMQNSPESIQSLISALNDNSVYVYFKDESINMLLRKNSWTGSITSSWDDSFYFLPISQTDVNLVKKVDINNTYAEDTYKRSINIDLYNPKNIEEYTQIQFVLPQDAMLTQATLKNPENKNITRNFGLDVKEGFIVYSTNISLNGGESASLQIDYESMSKKIDDGYLNFALGNTPSTSKIPVNLTISYPMGVPNTTKLPENMQVNNNTLQYLGTLSKNLMLNIPL